MQIFVGFVLCTFFFYYHTVTDEVRSVHDALIWLCRIQDLPVLMLLGAATETK